MLVSTLLALVALVASISAGAATAAAMVSPDSPGDTRITVPVAGPSRMSHAGGQAVAWLKLHGLYEGLRAKVARRADLDRPEGSAATALTRSPDGFALANPAHGFSAQFTGRGIELMPASRAAGPWRWGMQLHAYGPAGRGEPVGGAEVAERAGRVEYRYGSRLTEWYVDSPRGIEQGFTLHEAPRAASRGSVEVTLAVTGDLAPRIAPGGDGLHFVSADGRPVLAYRELHAWDARGRVLPSRMEAAERHVRLIVDDRGAEYPITVDPLVYLATELVPTGGKADDEFGWWVAISENTAVVGAPARETSPGIFAGSAFVFVQSGTSWTQQAELTASDGADGDAFGAAVGISEQTIVVGAPGNNPDGDKPGAGAAYVFRRTGHSWSQQAKLTASDKALSDAFGFAVAIRSNTVIVGAPSHDPGGKPRAGQAYVFERSGADAWPERARLTAPGAQAEDAFGFALAITDGGGASKSVVIGAPFFHQTTAGASIGRAFVFAGNGASWTQQAPLIPGDGQNGDAFGFAVDIEGPTAVVGAPAHNPGGKPFGGQAYVYVRNGTAWFFQAKLNASDELAGDLFGAAVAVDGNTVVATSPTRDTTAGDAAGQAYVFTRSGVYWTQQAILNAVDAAPEQFFGFAAAISGNAIVLSAPFHDVGAGPAAGPAYVFVPSQFFAAMWVGLRNSDDVGLRLDLKVTGVVGSGAVEGQVNNVSSGSSGFNNAILQTIALGLTGTSLPSQVTVWARVSCSGIGHASGIMRLWYNGRAIDTGNTREAGSRVELTPLKSFLRPGFVLSPTPGTSAMFVDQLLTSAVSCQAPGGRPFTPIGTWSAPST